MHSEIETNLAKRISGFGSGSIHQAASSCTWSVYVPEIIIWWDLEHVNQVINKNKKYCCQNQREIIIFTVELM